jgi:hypothetical protein
MRRLALALLLLLPVALAVRAEVPALAVSQAHELKQWLAGELASAGRRAAGARMFGRATRLYRGALVLVPGHEDAMTGLGYRRMVDRQSREARWVPGRMIAERDDLEGDRALRAEQGYLPELRELCTEAVRRWDEVAPALRAESRPAERAFWRALVDSLPGDLEEAEPARLRLGHVRNEEGNWRPAYTLKWRELGRAAWEKSGQGEAEEGQDEDEARLGVPLYRRAGTLVRMRSAHSDAFAAHAHQVAEAATRVAMAALDIEGAPFGRAAGQARRFEYTIFHGEDQRRIYHKWAELYAGGWDGRSGAQWGRGVLSYGAMARRSDTESDSHNDDAVANTMGYAVLCHRQGDLRREAVMLGFAYLVSGALLDTTILTRYGGKVTGRTGREEADTARLSETLEKPDGLRARALALARDPGHALHFSSGRLCGLITSQITADDAALALTLVEFLLHEHREGALRWFSRLADREIGFGEELEAAFGMKAAELDAGWRQWVLDIYTGCYEG